MKNIIKPLVWGTAALTFCACSENSSAPESIATKDNNNVLNSYYPDGDNTDSASVDSSDVLRSSFIQNALGSDHFNSLIHVDEDCPTLGNSDRRCGEDRYQENGKALVHHWMGFSGYFGCESTSASLSRYDVSIKSTGIDVEETFVQKTLHSSNEAISRAFKSDCDGEKGTYSEDSNGILFCLVDIPPTDTTDLGKTSYTDPNWSKYVEAIIDLCKNQPADIPPTTH